MLQEGKENKEAEELAKAKRKKERIQKCIQKEAELEQKRLEREQKRAQKKTRKATQKLKQNKKRAKRLITAPNLRRRIFHIRMKTATLSRRNLTCPGCSRGDKHPFRWVKCGECSTRWHFICADIPEFDLLDEAERKRVEFVCPLCN